MCQKTLIPRPQKLFWNPGSAQTRCVSLQRSNQFPSWIKEKGQGNWQGERKEGGETEDSGEELGNTVQPSQSQLLSTCWPGSLVVWKKCIPFQFSSNQDNWLWLSKPARVCEVTPYRILFVMLFGKILSQFPNHNGTLVSAVSTMKSHSYRMVKIRPLTESTQLNRLRLNFAQLIRDEHTTQNLCQSTIRERLGKYVKCKALSFFISIYFFPDSHTEVICRRRFTHNGLNYAQSGKKAPFWGLQDFWTYIWIRFPQNRQNWALICFAERLSCALMKIEVIEDWRHWLRCLLRCQLIFDDHCKRTVNHRPTAVKNAKSLQASRLT